MIPISSSQFINRAREITRELGHEVGENIEKFLKFAYRYPIVLNSKGGIKLAEADSPQEVERYLKALLRGYIKKRAAVIVLNEMGTIADPAVDIVLREWVKVPERELPVYSKYHRASMAAENKIGDLLEAYLAEQLESKGWFWCCGNIITGVDFLKVGNPVVLLQVKNRDNSENSSSEKIRELLKQRGCPVEIQKWHRCKSADGRTCWENFPGNEDEMVANEKAFQRFLRDYPKRRV